MGVRRAIEILKEPPSFDQRTRALNELENDKELRLRFDGSLLTIRMAPRDPSVPVRLSPSAISAIEMIANTGGVD